MKKRIYVLEDDEAIREILLMLLHEENYDAHGFASISEFIKGTKGDEPDLYLLDVMLPDGSGLDVCKMLKSTDRSKAVPVLIMSAHANFRQISLTCKAEGFVSKPFDIDLFINKIDETLH